MIILAHCNENFNDLQGAYLFAKIRKEQETYKANYPDADIISLGIGDVTQPLVPAVVEAMMKAVAEMGEAETFRGYGPEQGYLFCVKLLPCTISKTGDVMFHRMKFLLVMAQNVI